MGAYFSLETFLANNDIFNWIMDPFKALFAENGFLKKHSRLNVDHFELYLREFINILKHLYNYNLKAIFSGYVWKRTNFWFLLANSSDISEIGNS